jgi:hypothetical protein
LIIESQFWKNDDHSCLAKLRQTELCRQVSSRGAIQQTAAIVPQAQGSAQPMRADYPPAPAPTATPAPVASGRVIRTAQAPNANQEIAEQVGAVLSTAGLDGYEIEIRVLNGVATLEGNVRTQSERVAATKAVSTIPGIKVQNRLVCTEQSARPASQPMTQVTRTPVPPAQTADVRGAAFHQPLPAGQPAIQEMPAQGGAMPMAPSGPPAPPQYGYQGAAASQAVYNMPSMPDHSWPTYAQYPNSAAVTYPQQYSASAWPYIGPFYPYPQVPLGWRDATLRWDDGQWNLMFRPRTDRWWWFLNPNNW